MTLPTADQVSSRSRLVAALLCWFLGIFGVHRFYVGKTGTGIAMIFTLGGLGVWSIIDFILILVGSFRDAEGKLLWRWTEPGALTGEVAPPSNSGP